MTFQPSKRKSLSERFGDISSNVGINCKDNKDFVQNLKPNSTQSKQCDVGMVGNRYSKPNDPGAGNLTVHLKINQLNRQRKENSYVNRPCQPLRMEYRDKPSDITKQFTKNMFDEGKENNRMNFSQGLGRQISVKQTSINTSENYYNTSRCNNSNQLSPRSIYNNQTFSRFNSIQTDPRCNNINQTSPRFTSSNQTSPRFTSSNQTSPRFTSSNQSSPRFQSSNQTSPRLNNTNKISPRFNNSNQISPRFNSSNQISPRFNNTNNSDPSYNSSISPISPRCTNSYQTSPRFNSDNHSSNQYHWNHTQTPSKNVTNFVSNDLPQQYCPRRNSYPPLDHQNGFESRTSLGLTFTEKPFEQWPNNTGQPQNLFGVDSHMNNHFNSQVTPSNNSGFSGKIADKDHDSEGRFMGNYMNSDHNITVQGTCLSNNSENFNSGSKTFSSNSNINSSSLVSNPRNGNLVNSQAPVHQSNSFQSSVTQPLINKSPVHSYNNLENVRPVQYTDKNVKHENYLHKNDVNSSGNIQCLNKSPRNNRQYMDDFNYNAVDQKSCVQKVKYGLNNNILPSGETVYSNKKNNILPSGETVYQNNNSNGYTVSYEDQPYSPNQQIIIPSLKSTTSQYGHVSPTFSTDSEITMDSNHLSSESNSSQQSTESSKPTGFYIDLSKEISEVEALKQKFIEECECMISTAEDEKTMEMVKKSLQILPVSGSKSQQTVTNKKQDCKIQKKLSIDIPTKLIIDESKKDDDSCSNLSEEKDLFIGSNNEKYDDMKFEGRTLLKGGVKPRHVPKMLIDKPGLGPPEDRRVIYLTARNLLELPLPKWAAEVLGKSVLEHDISNGLNKEKNPGKHKEKCSQSGQEKKKETSSNKSKLDQRLTEIFEVKANDSKKRMKKSPSNNSKKMNNGIDTKNSCKSKASSYSAKRSNMDSTPASPNKNMTANKKMRVEGKSKIDLTLGGTVLNKKGSAIDTSKKVVNEKSKMNGTSDKEKAHQSSKHYRDRSISRDSSRSKGSRSRDTSRSRNRSRSRESSRSSNRSRSPWSRQRYCQRSSKMADNQHKSTERTSYKSNIRDSRKRSPVKTGNKIISHNRATPENIMASITSRASKEYLDTKLKRDDMFDSDRNKFRATDDAEDALHSMECR